MRIHTLPVAGAVRVVPALDSTAPVGLTDTLIAHQSIAAVAVGGAMIEACTVHARLVPSAICVRDALPGRRCIGHAGALLARLRQGALGIGGALEVTEAVLARFVEPALRIGHTDNRDYLALTGNARFTWVAVAARGARKRRCLIGHAASRRLVA